MAVISEMEVGRVAPGSGGLERVHAPVRDVMGVEQSGMGMVSGERAEAGPGADVGRRDRRRIHVHARILLFPLCPPVLEPDFHLSLRQTQTER